MSRTKKAVNYQEELARIDMRIEKYKGAILEAQEKRRQLLEEKEHLELDALYQAIRESGKSVEEAAAMLRDRLGPEALKEVG